MRNKYQHFLKKLELRAVHHANKYNAKEFFK